MSQSPKGSRKYLDLRPLFMSFGNLFAHSTKEAAEKAARLVLRQLSERLHISKNQPNIDEEMECLQFGICTYKAQL